MKVLGSLSELSEHPRKLGVTIGNFDGVHCGHQKMLNQIISDCRKNNLDVVVMTFRPHPKQILNPQEDFLINTYNERLKLLEKLDIDYVVEIEFTRDFSTLSPQAFLDQYVYNERLEKLYLGYDFAFGADKEGDSQFVQKYADKRGIHFNVLEEYTLESEKTSSSHIRELIKQGDVEGASQLLGRPFYIRGRVVKGEGRGKTIGFPTANLDYDFYRIIPKVGVYVTKTTYKDQTYHSVTNVGYNPTFNSERDIHVETHILDFDTDIYGDELGVEFISHIRSEMKFSSVNELVGQIKEDVSQAKEYFKNA